MMAQQDAQSLAWYDFMTKPGAYADVSHIGKCFSSSLTPRLVAELKSCVRLQDRLGALLIAQYSLSPWLDLEACPQKDRYISLLPGDRFADVARRAGAIYWASSLATAVLASDVQALQQQLGPDLYNFALAHRDLSSPVQDLPPRGTLDSAVMNEGWKCFEAWRRVLPKAVGERILLKLPADYASTASLESFSMQGGPDIVRCAGHFEGGA